MKERSYEKMRSTTSVITWYKQLNESDKNPILLVTKLNKSTHKPSIQCIPTLKLLICCQDLSTSLDGILRGVLSVVDIG